MDPLDGRCRTDQIEACRDAVRGDQLLTFDNGGRCEARSYDVYDQLCTLNYYTHGVDYCCCGFERSKALCCRFHYAHNYFRCDSSEDSLYVPPSMTTILIICGVSLALVLIVVIVTAVKCAQARRHSDGSDSECSPSKNGVRESDSSHGNPENEPLQRPMAPSAGADTALPPSEYHLTQDGVAVNNNASAAIVPTAPPPDESADPLLVSGGAAVPPPYQHQSISVQEQPGRYQQDPASRVARSQSEAPPGYDEHHLDRPYYHGNGIATQHHDNPHQQQPSVCYPDSLHGLTHANPERL